MGETDSGRGCMFYGCVGVLLVGLLLGGLAALSLWRAWQAMPDIDPCCEAYLTAVGDGNYKAAYDLTNERWRAAQPFPKFVEFETKMRKALGACTSKSRTGWKVNVTPGGTIAAVTYSATFEKGQGAVSFVLTQEGDTWRIQSVNYNSPALLNAIK